jgi:transcriptional regulator with XRE-family HTH domain
MSQQKASTRAGFDHSYFSRLISGSRMPTAKSVNQIADALNWTVNQRRTAMMAAGFLPDDALRAVDADLIELVDALARVEAHDPVWAESVRDNTRALTNTANRLADMYERVQQ